MIRLGLCCIFRDQPIKFRNTTAAALGRLSRNEGLTRLASLCVANADALLAALQYCADHGIGCFRINSQILPLKTHRVHGYSMDDLPGGLDIVARFRACRQFADAHSLRTTFHPDQFVVLNSPRAEVVRASLQEIEYQAEVAEWVGADVVNIHAGGVFGDKAKALADCARSLDRLSERARRRITLENDDRLYTPADLLPLCAAAGIPLVYDVHHHRCHGDGLSVEQATESAMETWDREPLFHISSPLEGWSGPRPQRHHDFIDGRDFPECWRGLHVTVEVEAKAKEAAVLCLRQELASRHRRKNSPARKLRSG